MIFVHVIFVFVTIVPPPEILFIYQVLHLMLTFPYVSFIEPSKYNLYLSGLFSKAIQTFWIRIVLYPNFSAPNFFELFEPEISKIQKGVEAHI